MKKTIHSFRYHYAFYFQEIVADFEQMLYMLMILTPPPLKKLPLSQSVSYFIVDIFIDCFL